MSRLHDAVGAFLKHFEHFPSPNPADDMQGRIPVPELIELRNAHAATPWEPDTLTPASSKVSEVALGDVTLTPAPVPEPPATPPIDPSPAPAFPAPEGAPPEPIA